MRTGSRAPLLNVSARSDRAQPHSTAARRLDLVVALRYEPGDWSGERALWREFFAHVSAELQVATRGQLALGRVELVRDPRASANADVWIVPRAAGTHARGARRWSAGTHVEFARDDAANVGLFVHELGHYLFDLYDEYAGPRARGLRCGGTAEHGGCLMNGPDPARASGWVKLDVCDPRAPERRLRQLYGSLEELLAGLRGDRGPRGVFRPGSARFFCAARADSGASAHDAEAPSFQNARHADGSGGTSCWSVIARPGAFAHTQLGLEFHPDARTNAPAAHGPEVVDVDALARAPVHAEPRGAPATPPRVRSVRPSRSDRRR